MNTCPIYRRSGGHSYGSTVPGPIGSVLTPGLDLERYASLPFASTLCGSCTAVCPVKIDLDGQLFRWRQHVTEAGYTSSAKTLAIKTSVKLFDRPRLFRAAGELARLGLRIMPKAFARIAAGPWGRTRDVPPAPAESFRSWYRRNRAERR
jgi:L-lactate dehydrogenase complex protein LldF